MALVYVPNVYAETIIFIPKKRRNEISQQLINRGYNKDHVESQLTKVDDTPYGKNIEIPNKGKKRKCIICSRLY